MNRNIVEQDFDFFIQSCEECHYNNPDSARTSNLQSTKSDEIEINEEVATQLVMFCRQVVA